jgi:pimeloyl-ACP methyl ester carboxylesterase
VRGRVAFAVGTQGMGTQCAPSRQMAAGREYESVFITGLLARGYNVVVPDYQGLGMRSGSGAATHTYMSREVQGRVVLDALRAAQQLDSADIPADGPTAIAGYSQGGGAAASAAELWHSYAAELDMKGAVCGATPADFPLVARMLDGSPYFAFLGYALVGLSADYGIDLGPLLNARGLEVASAMTEQCMFESLRRYAFTRSSTLTADGRSIGSMLRDEPFATIVADQQLGNGRSPRMEALISHSRLDDVVPFECGRGLAERWAGQGARVRLSVNYAPTHAAAALTSYGTAFSFLNGRFAGRAMRANTSRYLKSLAE